MTSNALYVCSGFGKPAFPGVFTPGFARTYAPNGLAGNVVLAPTGKGPGPSGSTPGFPPNGLRARVDRLVVRPERGEPVDDRADLGREGPDREVVRDPLEVAADVRVELGTAVAGHVPHDASPRRDLGVERVLGGNERLG